MPRHLHGFNDIDFVGEVDQCCSISRYIFILLHGAISWGSTRQKLTVLSSTKVEYVAMAIAASELVWLRVLLHDLHYTKILKTPTFLYCDNKSVLALMDTTRFHSCTKHMSIRYHFTKHMSIRYHFICQLATQNKVVFNYCPTHNKHADILTKSLTRSKLGLLGREIPHS